MTERQTIDPTTGSPAVGESRLHGVSANPYVMSNRSYGLSSSYKGAVGVDETITDIPSGYQSYNEVTHTKKVWNAPLNTLVYKGRSNEYLGRTQEASTIRHCSCGYSLLNNAPLSSYPSHWDSDSNALVRATNGLEFSVQPAGLQLPIFIGELTDYRNVLDLITGRGFNPRHDLPQRSSETLKKFYRKWKRRPFMETIRAMASGDLFVQFAVKPLLSDLNAMKGISQHLATQMDRLRRSKSLRTRYTVKDTGETFSSQTGTTDVHTRRTISYTRHITAFALFDLDTSTLPTIPPWLVAADAFGFDEPLETTLELIPFSFVLEYFIKVSDWLDNFRGGFLQFPYTIVQDGYSIKKVTTVEAESQFEAGPYVDKYANYEGKAISKGTLEYTYYIRRLGPLPYGSIAQPRVTLPNLRQVRNLVDLLVMTQ